MNRADVLAMEQALENEHGPLRTYRPQRRQCVYFVVDVQAAVCKIGVATDPRKRLAALQNAYPHKLQLIATEPGGQKRERELHAEFSEQRLHGEWFRLDAALSQHINALLESPEQNA